MCSLPIASISAHPVDIGQRSEAAILGELVKRGYRVLVPFGVNHRYDLVIDLGDRFLTCQCKTGRLRHGSVVFHSNSMRSNTRGAVIRDYRGQVDLFLVYCPDTAGGLRDGCRRGGHVGGPAESRPAPQWSARSCALGA